MSLTFAEARDEIYTVFKTAWDPTGYSVFYEDVAKDRDTRNTPWAVLTLRHATGFQATLSMPGTRVFRREGILTVQVFTPVGKGLQDYYGLAKVVVDAYEGHSTPGGVWFRDTRIAEVGRDGKFFQSNVLTNFQYDEIK